MSSSWKAQGIPGTTVGATQVHGNREVELRQPQLFQEVFSSRVE